MDGMEVRHLLRKNRLDLLAAGYFGPIAQEQMKSAGTLEVWW